jgi:hypothetical protein
MMHSVTNVSAHAVDVELPNDIWSKIGNVVKPGTQEYIVGVVKLPTDFRIAQCLAAYVFSISPNNPGHEHVIVWQQLPAQNL